MKVSLQLLSCFESHLIGSLVFGSSAYPSSLILSAEMMMRYLGWKEAADNILKGVRWAIKNKLVTYDLERLMKDATLLKCSEFADEINHGMTTEYFKYMES